MPSPLGELVMRCLGKRPADRWQSAQEIVTRLEAMATPSGGTEPLRAVTAVQESGSRPRVIRLAAFAGAVVLVVLLAWFAVARFSGGTQLDPNVVAVLPFRVASGRTDLAYLREGVVDMLATLLTGEEGTARAADPALAIAAWRKHGASESADLDAEATAAVAHELGAGRVLSGSIFGAEAKLTIRASLVSSGSRAEPLQASVEGPADSVQSLLAQLAGRLLAQSAGLKAEQSAGLLTASLPALRAFLRGQADYRKGEYASAMVQFTEALQGDSNFAQAGAGLSAANGWMGTLVPEMVALAQRSAWRNRHRLSPKERAILVGRLGPNGPGPDYRSKVLAAAEQAVLVAPDRAEAWYSLGDKYFHDGLMLGIEDALVRGEQGLRRAIERDSLDTGVLEHLLLLAAWRLDTTEVKWIVGLRQRAVTDEQERIPKTTSRRSFSRTRPAGIGCWPCWT